MKPKTYLAGETLPEWAVPGARVVVRQGSWTKFGRIATTCIRNGTNVANVHFDDGTTDIYDLFWIRPLSLIEEIGELELIEEIGELE